MKTLTRKLGRRVVHLLPSAVRHELGRRLQVVGMEPVPGLVLKVAETDDEWAGAFKLLYEAYRLEGICAEQDTGMRITKYNLVPTTITLVAKVDERVVATVSIVQDGPLGLPMDAAFDLSAQRRGGRRLTEISGLAIAPDYRRSGGMLSLMAKFLINVIQRHTDTDVCVAAANPRHDYLYESLWVFTRMTVPVVPSYAFANGAPAVPWCMNLRTWGSTLTKAYRRVPKAHDLDRFILQDSHEALRFPAAAGPLPRRPRMSVAAFRRFFTERSDVVRSLSERELGRVRDTYLGTEIHRLLPAPLCRSGAAMAKDSRHPIEALVRVRRRGDDTAKTLQIRDASPRGLGVSGAHDLSVGEQLRLDVAISKTDWITIDAVVAWSRPDGRAGFSLVESSSRWSEYVDWQAGAGGRLEQRAPSHTREAS